MAACWNLYVFLPFSIFISVFSLFCYISKDCTLFIFQRFGVECSITLYPKHHVSLNWLPAYFRLYYRNVCVSVRACLSVYLLHTDTKFIANIDFLPEGWTPDMKSYWSFKYNTHAFLWNCVWTACICNLCIKGGCVLYVCFVVCSLLYRTVYINEYKWKL